MNHLWMTISSYAAGLITIGLIWFAKYLRRPKPVPPNFIRVAGRLIDTNDFTPEVLEKIREEYRFSKPAKKSYLVITDLTATCPGKHIQHERIGLFGRDPDVSGKLSERIVWSRSEVPCMECGKKAKLTARSLHWQGDFETWDGAL